MGRLRAVSRHGGLTAPTRSSKNGPSAGSCRCRPNTPRHRRRCRGLGHDKGLAMRVADKNIPEVFDQGYTIVENFIDKESLAAAQEALWTIHPKPQDYFADPEKHAKYAKSQFAGIQLFPFDKWELSRLAVYPDLIDMAERFHGTTEI